MCCKLVQIADSFPTNLQVSRHYCASTTGLCLRFDGLLALVEVIDDENKSSFRDLLYPMASILDPTYGIVWIEDDLPCPDNVKQNLTAKLKDAIIKKAEKLCPVHAAPA